MKYIQIVKRTFVHSFCQMPHYLDMSDKDGNNSLQSTFTEIY